MTEQEIIAKLAENDLKAIRPILSFLAGQTDIDRIMALDAEQNDLRRQLAEVRNAFTN